MAVRDGLADPTHLTEASVAAAGERSSYCTRDNVRQMWHTKFE